jgi:hypothetical protein
VNECRATLENGLLTLENDRICRVYAWNEGHLIGQQIADQASGRVWDLANQEPDCVFPGADAGPTGGDLAVTPLPATAIKPAHLQVDVTTSLGGLQVRHRFRIYPGCPAVACDLYLRGRLDGVELWDATSPASMERLCLSAPHLRLECVCFYDITDRRNTLLSRRSVLPYRAEGRLSGNLLFVRDAFSSDGLGPVVRRSGK